MMLKSSFLKTNPFMIILILLLFLLPSCILSTSTETHQDQEVADLDKLEEEKPAPEADISEVPADLIPDDALSSVNFGIYNGVGSWDVNVEALENLFKANNLSYALFDEYDIMSDYFLNQFDLIWFPGGFAAEYRYYIDNHQSIRDFVADGGSFIGSCAGAYYAADLLRWMGEDFDYPLKLFNGAAVGPLVNEINWGEEAEIFLNPALAANDGYVQVLPVYYFDGPYFDANDESEITVISHYVINNQPAIIAGRYGQGKYLLFGPHPELGGYNDQLAGHDTTGNNNAQWPWLFRILGWFRLW
jgi:glutamine amidotransferase-like uncharacterized protein